MIKKYWQKGFTLVESTIAVAFLSILLVSIVMLSLKAGSMYVKGDTNKAVNQAGRDISDALRRDFLTTDMNSISVNNGRLCVGKVAYVWNLVNKLSTGDSDVVKVNGAKAFLVRIPKMSSNICSHPSTSVSGSDTTDLLQGTKRDYALYNFSATPIAQIPSLESKRGLYHISFTVGTFDKSATMTATDSAGKTYSTCKPNNVRTADFNYCSVNDFDMIVRVGGGVTS